ncbi:MAG TPA: deoxyribonuclease V [Nitrospirota bacterium]|nr:deoxyribonuclease V [Nitrospirota bacterium]
MRAPDIIWPKTIDHARQMQEHDRRLVLIEPLHRPPEYVAGVDAAFSEDRVFAAACLYCYPQLMLVEHAAAEKRLVFPYVPGYLLFREGPAIIAALKKLKKKPDVILIDGQGIAHPRGIGSASHFGVLLDVPTIGCAKTRLIGEYREPGELKGNWTELQFNGRIVGAVLRTRDRVRPLFLSPGHRIDLQGAITIALGCVGRYRIPEPLRGADMLSKKNRW